MPWINIIIKLYHPKTVSMPTIMSIEKNNTDQKFGMFSVVIRLG